MTHDEMETLLRWLKGNFPNLSEEQVETYSAMLMPESASLASKAILDGIKVWRFPPTWAEINERIAALKRAYAPVPAPTPDDVEDYTIPRWVRRWVYARHLLKPPDMRPFPESYPIQWTKGDTPADGWMPEDAYEQESRAVTDQQVRQVTAGVKPTLRELLAGP